MAKPLILLTNDDGIYAQGILAAWQELRKIGEVEVVAPDAERSAVGHAITLLLPLRTKEVVRRNVRFGYAVNGMPADCVKIAVKEGETVRPGDVLAVVDDRLLVRHRIEARRVELGGRDEPALWLLVERPDDHRVEGERHPRPVLRCPRRRLLQVRHDAPHLAVGRIGHTCGERLVEPVELPQCLADVLVADGKPVSALRIRGVARCRASPAPPVRKKRSGSATRIRFWGAKKGMSKSLTPTSELIPAGE